MRFIWLDGVSGLEISRYHHSIDDCAKMIRDLMATQTGYLEMNSLGGDRGIITVILLVTGEDYLGS